MTNKKRLFLLDAYALIYRSFFAFVKNPRISSKGIDTSAIFGFVNTLVEVIRKENPTHMAVVFDTSSPTFRHDEFPQYKAHRDPTPDGILQAKPYIDRLLDSMNIQKLYLDGYEADDLIGTIAKKAEQADFQVYMMTPDKDFAQLVSENIFMYKPANKWSASQVLGIKEVLEKFQINKVSQVIDFLAMMGDSADNIPGLSGVGEKTAQKFIAEYGSMEGLLANTHKITGKLREKVEGSKEQGILSKKLVTIETNAPVDFKPERLALQQFNIEKIQTLFNELEFKTILPRVLSLNNLSKENEKTHTQERKTTDVDVGQLDMFLAPHKSKDINITEKKDYIILTEKEQIKSFYKNVKQRRKCSFQILSSTTSDFENSIVGVSFSYSHDAGFYFPFSEKSRDFINEIFLDKEIVKVGFNIKEQIKTLKNHNISEIKNIFDVSIAHYLLEPEMRHDIGILSENYLQYKSSDITIMLGKGIQKRSVLDLSQDKQMFYCCELADIQLQLSKIFSLELKKMKMLNLFTTIEMPLVSVLIKMELEGINLDADMLSGLSIELTKEIKSIEEIICKLSGQQFNISSPKQLGEVLFEKMKISDKIKKTKSGQYSTSEETLSNLKDSHPIIKEILDYRALQKMLSTYVNALPLLINKKTGRIHTTFNQTVASTGRLSSVNPNLQNIPIRREKGRKIRMAFIPKNEDYLIFAADYSQIELRIMASLSQDESMIKAFNNGEDIHVATAAKVYNVAEKEVTREMRSNAKMVNFGIIYGISAFGLSQRLGIKRKEASEIINQYFAKFPKVKEFIDKSILKARENEYVETILGRKRYLKEINSRNAVLRGFAERNAINAPIQGSAADIIKKAMIDVQAEIQNQNLKSRMLLQVHDELVFDMKKSENEVFVEMVKEKMEHTIKLNVPLVVDTDIGENWLEAH